MISFVRGKVFTIQESSAIIDTGAIGYEVFMTTRDLNRLRSGGDVFLYTYFQVREDAMSLFGFLNKDDLEVFRLLLGISGVGPKAALGILGAISANDLRFAVLSEDVKTISGAPGVGKKTAQKLILELKDKFKLETAFEKALEGGEEVAAETGSLEGPKKEAIEALTALGYSLPEARTAVAKVELKEDMDVEGILKAALKNL